MGWYILLFLACMALILLWSLGCYANSVQGDKIQFFLRLVGNRKVNGLISQEIVCKTSP